MPQQRSTVGVAPNNGDKQKRERMSSVKSGPKKGSKRSEKNINEPSTSKSDEFLFKSPAGSDVALEDEHWTYITCTTVFTDSSDKMLECERCSSHHCTKCLGKSDDEYRILQDSHLMWFCGPCKVIIKKNIATDLEIEQRCNAIMQMHDSRIQNLEEIINTKCDESKVREIIKEALEKPSVKSWATAVQDGSQEPNKDLNTQIFSKMNDRKARENNLIMFGIQESKSEVNEERNIEDVKIVKYVLKTCGIETNDSSLAKVFRLGKLLKDKVRPLFVTLNLSEDTKALIFRGCKNLRDHSEYNTVSVANDLTREEREQEKIL